MKRKRKNNFPAKYVLLFMSIFCIILIACSVRLSLPGTVANAAAGYVIVPMQKGINRVGNGLLSIGGSLSSRKKLLEENEELSQELADAKAELNQAQIDQEELKQFRQLYDMDQTYADYDKIAVNVIGKDSGNWFSTFLIDRGSNSGIEVGMNVIADDALAGIVIDVGPNYATVRSIIDDNSNISCKDLSTDQLMIVEGSLQAMNTSGMVLFSNLRDADDIAKTGDLIVTSNISDLYLPNIPVGYVTEITTDSNKLTKSGSLATIVDFSQLEKVFVITQTKEGEGGVE